MSDRTTGLQLEMGVASNLSDRANFDMQYAASPPCGILLPEAFIGESLIIPYYDMSVVTDTLPPQSKYLIEMMSGLMATCDQNDRTIALVDFQNQLVPEGFASQQPLGSVSINLETILSNLNEKTKLMALFSRQNIDLPESEIVYAVDFLQKYIPFASSILELMSKRYPLGNTKNWKSLPFKTLYSSCRYLDRLREKDVDETPVLDLITQSPSTFVSLFSGDLTDEEINDSVQQANVIINSPVASTLYELDMQMMTALPQLMERQWSAYSVDSPEKKELAELHYGVEKEQVNMLVKTYVFILKELYLAHGDGALISSAINYGTELMSSVIAVFDPDFIIKQLSISPDIFDRLVGFTTIEGRQTTRDLAHLILKTAALTSETQKKLGTEASGFYEKYFTAIGAGEFSYDETTVDSEMERSRSKGEIEFINEREKNMTPPGYGVRKILECGVGTGRLLSWLREQFPGLNVYGIDILKLDLLRSLGLPDDIPVANINAKALTKEDLQREFNIDQVDLISYPASMLADLSKKEIQAALKNGAAVARYGMLDVPLVAAGQGGYLEQMIPGATPHTIEVDFGHGVKKQFNLLPPEDWVNIVEEARMKILNIPPKGPERELFYAQLRQETAERNGNGIKSPAWRTKSDRPRFSLLFSCQEDHESTEKET